MEGCIIVGTIVNTHGVRGEVRIIPHTDDPARFNKLKSIYVDKKTGLEKFIITGVKYHKNFVILKFDGIDDMDEALTLKGLDLMIQRKDAVKLPQDSYFIVDLIGCSVYDEKRGLLGIVDDVLRTGSNDVYVVKNNEKKEILIPVLKTVVKKVSIEDKRIDVILPKGLLDDEV